MALLRVAILVLLAACTPQEIPFDDADLDGVPDSEDCDDHDASVHPGAEELCNGVDDDCDGAVDEEPAYALSYFPDADADGWGHSSRSTTACAPPPGHVAVGGDCDDGDARFHPGAVEDDCTDPNDYNCDGSTGYADEDGDGWVACEDCDDLDASVHPEADEACNEVDDDCDGSVDEDAVDGSTFYADVDEDGFGDDDTATWTCEAPEGYVAAGGDCDDDQPLAWPGADEVCDGLDNDCDGTVDGPGSLDATDWFADTDGDGFGTTLITVRDCTSPEGYVLDSTDCDDSEAAVNPDADELCNEVDDDCDGSVDEDEAVDASTWYADADEDGYGDADVSHTSCEAPTGYLSDATDCDDTDADVHPDETEVCNEVDDDCDGTVDEDDAVDASTWYADDDGDGHGDADDSHVSCDAPTGYVSDATDCDDADSAVNPDETEICNEVDDDCDGTVDEDDALGAPTWYADIDGDGYGDASDSHVSCEAPTGYVADHTDCDDDDGDVNPGADELCDGSTDEDCDGSIDEDDAADATTWYEDGDSDGYGDSSSTHTSCVAPTGYVSDDTDCDDADAAVNPGEDELCDGSTDEDCDGNVDEADAVDALTWYADADSDSYGDADASTSACTAPTGYVSDSSDCDDTDASISPAGTEVCDGSDDEDCDGIVDEDDASDASTFYLDGDSDGYGDSSSSTTACEQPSGYVSDDTDCDDGQASVNPGALELCDGSTDEDCDGSVDEDDASDASTWYLDDDGDGYGDASSPDTACTAPTDFVADATDCDDGDASVNPGADEVCDGSVDEDCDGTVDEDDAVDADTFYLDDDGDGYGDSSCTDTACSAPSGWVSDDTDCDDTDSDVNPGASESCNGLDDDCSGYVDDGSACTCDVEYDGSAVYLFCEGSSLETGWSSARSDCQGWGYDLVTIDDATEDAFVEGVCDGFSTSGGEWWIGINDITTEDTFVWVDGSSSSYRNWHTDEPNDWDGNEDCGAVHRWGDDTWNDMPCSTTLAYICEL